MKKLYTCLLKNNHFDINFFFKFKLHSNRAYIRVVEILQMCCNS
jgi:hypothetical protein